MTSRSRSSTRSFGPWPRPRAWLVAALLGLGSSGSSAQDLPELPKSDPLLPSASQDVPLYRDPDPSEGPRIQGPVLSTRAVSTPPPPPSSLGPFQGPGPGLPSLGATAADGPEPIQQPLLGIPPILPPLPALPMAPMLPDDAFGMKRTTIIRWPHGTFGRFTDWYRGHFGSRTSPPTPVPVPVPTTANRRTFFGIPLWPIFAGGGTSGSSTTVPEPGTTPDGSSRWFGRTLFSSLKTWASD